MINGNSPALLVVEDDEDARSELVDMFTSGGIGTVAAADGIEALVLSERYQSIRVILTDIYMPRMDGLNFVGELQRLNDRGGMPRLIFLTGRQTFTDAVTALRLRAWDFLSKSMAPGAVLDRVRAALADADNDPPKNGSTTSLTPQTYRDILRSLLAERKAARRHVHAELFSDPCWDMLLELYTTVLEGVDAALREANFDMILYNLASRSGEDRKSVV